MARSSRSPTPNEPGSADRAVVGHAVPMTETPVEHVVLVRWKPGEIREDLAKLTELALDFPNTIPGVRAVRCGPSVSPEGLEGGFDWGLVVSFVSAAARDGYLPHPAHQPVKDLIGRWADGIIVFDV